MKFKALFVFFFGIVLSMIGTQNSFAGWPINYVSAIEGIITDATTGEPIENVIVEGNWEKKVYSPPSATWMIYRRELAITDKNGHYKLHSKLSLHVFSSFYGIDITLRHPLYKIKYLPVPKERLYDVQRSNGDLKNCDLKLLSLAEKYRNIDRNNIYEKNIPMQIHDLSREMMGNSAANYFKDAAKLGVKKDYFKYIYNSWQVIIGRYNDNEQGYLKEQFNRFKNYYGMDY